MQTPVTIYVVHHPQCTQAELLASRRYDWFRLGYQSGDSSAAGLPVYFRHQLLNSALHPEIPYDEAGLNVVIVLVDHKMVGDDHWRKAVVDLAEEIHGKCNKPNGKSAAILLPCAMHDSFYRTGPLYEYFNAIRLLNMNDDKMVATVRRATTEATARWLLSEDCNTPRPLKVFLSHAKRDGRQIAESIRDEIRKFSQLEAWYDANDLPYGASWDSPMEAAAKDDTAAMIVTFTDAYPTRPWCRREAMLARTPTRIAESKGSQVWKVQPVVAVHQPGPGWVRGVPRLEGVPRIGWNDIVPEDQTERVVDRLVLEVLLANVHRRVALDLEKHRSQESRRESCFIT